MIMQHYAAFNLGLHCLQSMHVGVTSIQRVNFNVYNSNCKKPVRATKIFQYYTCPAGRVRGNFHSSCKHMHLSFKSICNKEHKGVILPSLFHNYIPYTDKKIFRVNTQKMLVSLSDFSTRPVVQML